MEEKIIIVDNQTLTLKSGDVLYYIICYSTLTKKAEKVSVSAKEYEFIVSNIKTIDTSKHFQRFYNSYKNTFNIKYIN